MTPIKAIRAKCLDCCCGQSIEVRLCTHEKCALYPYRMGHRPKVDNHTTQVVDSEKLEIQGGVTMRIETDSKDPNRIALLNAQAAIRKHCIKCKQGNLQDVWRCQRSACDLYSLRPIGYGYRLPDEKR